MHIGDIQLSSALRNRCIISESGAGTVAHMSLANGTPANAGSVRLTALPVEQAVALLRRAGSQRLTIEVMHADLAAGAPTNADGTVNLITYGAWLVRAVAQRDQAHGG
jgi:hypothetical protein